MPQKVSCLEGGRGKPSRHAAGTVHPNPNATPGTAKPRQGLGSSSLARFT